ncbi:MAG: DUF11 domain-containing protein [Methanosarcinales archaeon]|nr:DUF11 domain-containing protein [Methanosarcinales archaeon]
MRLIYRAILTALLLALIVQVAWAEEGGTRFDEFSLSTGDRVDIGKFRIEMVDVQSIRDGLVLVRVSRSDGDFDEQRVLLENSANQFAGGAGDGGITVTVIDIFDEESAKLRLEYPENMGTARKRASDLIRPTRALPDLTISKSFENRNINVGDEVKVTVTVKNQGLDTARNIQVSDQPPLSEFVYLAGYPPKIKSQLDPGETDVSVYVISAVKEGPVRIPPIEVRYSDSNDNIKSNNSEPFEVSIAPRKRPKLELRIETPPQLKFGEPGTVNITVSNTGQVSATRVEISSAVRPQEGLDVSGLERTFFEIPAGGKQSYSSEIRGTRSSNYSITLKANYEGADSLAFSEATGSVLVLEREYKYLYYILIVPVAIIALWLYKRYKEYKY